MAKRRLSKQQQQRIKKNVTQQAECENLNSGLIVRHHGKFVDILPCDPDGNVENSQNTQGQNLIRCHFRAKLKTVVCGDIVRWQYLNENHDDAVIESICERRTEIKRPRPYQDPKPIVANIDQILLVIAPKPEPISSLIDRYLIAAATAGLSISLVINKTDLLNLDENQAVKQEITELKVLYTRLGYEIYETSTQTNQNAQQDLTKLLSGKSSILVGQSGVGKSSLINRLLSKDAAEVGDISAVSDKGKHTTVTSELFLSHQLPQTAIIDSPGIREFGLWHLSVEDVTNGMSEIRTAAENCRFRDCIHGQSKGCGVSAAIDNGDIHPRRASSYFSIIDSLEENSLNSK